MSAMYRTVGTEPAGSAARTQMLAARAEDITPQMKKVAEREGCDLEFVMREVAAGRAIIPANIRHANIEPAIIGVGFTCKVNVNIGNSPVCSGIDTELEKLHAAIHHGADTVMDLSTGGDLDAIRKEIISRSTVPVGTVPLYQVVSESRDIVGFTHEDILNVISRQAEQGVDFMTVHAGMLQRHLSMLSRRTTGIVSRGGAILARWMRAHHRENPLYTHFDDILDICSRYDVSLSLGDALRPGCVADASDDPQFAELRTLGDLTLRAWERGVQVMIEGPGHVPLDQIAMNVQMEMELCHEAPFYTLGPLPTDIAPGYDHITSAIGAALIGYYGASMLCCVTPKEHLGLPDLEDVRQGVLAYRIAAHTADIARRRPGARRRDDDLSHARFEFDWKRQFALSLDPDTARRLYEQAQPEGLPRGAEFCSMCGPKFCAMRLARDDATHPTHAEKDPHEE